MGLGEYNIKHPVDLSLALRDGLIWFLEGVAQKYVVMVDYLTVMEIECTAKNDDRDSQDYQ